MKYTSKQNGFELVEVVVVTAMIAIALVVIVGVAQKGIQVSRYALNQAQASFLLEEGVEATKTIRDNNWSTISGLTNGTTYYLSYASGSWSLSNTTSTIGGFTRTIVPSAVNRDSNDDITASGGTLDSGTRKFTVTVTWSSAGSTVTKSIIFYLSNIFG